MYIKIFLVWQKI